MSGLSRKLSEVEIESVPRDFFSVPVNGRSKVESIGCIVYEKVAKGGGGSSPAISYFSVCLSL